MFPFFLLMKTSFQKGIRSKGMQTGSLKSCHPSLQMAKNLLSVSTHLRDQLL